MSSEKEKMEVKPSKGRSLHVFLQPARDAKNAPKIAENRFDLDAPKEDLVNALVKQGLSISISLETANKYKNSYSEESGSSTYAVFKEKSDQARISVPEEVAERLVDTLLANPTGIRVDLENTELYKRPALWQRFPGFEARGRELFVVLCGSKGYTLTKQKKKKRSCIPSRRVPSAKPQIQIFDWPRLTHDLLDNELTPSNLVVS